MAKVVFPHERLDAYQFASKFFELALDIRDRLPVGLGSLGDELDRAAGSVQRNVGEGASLYTRPMKLKHFRIALGSAGECAVILDQIRIRRGASVEALAQAREVLESTYLLTVGLVKKLL
jgi:four helix bundle protein